MVTGIHKQVLYSGRKAGGGSPAFAAFLVFFSILLALSVKTGFIKNLSFKKPFLTEPLSFAYFVGILSLCLVVFTIAGPLRKKSSPVAFLLILADGYFLAEILYRIYPLHVPHGVVRMIGVYASLHLDSFFLHRLYHLIAIIPALIILKSGVEGNYENYLNFGDTRVKTSVLGGKEEQAWNVILKKFAVLVVPVFVILSMPVFFKKSASPSLLPSLFIPIILYAAWNSLAEEVVFRGIMLPIFTQSSGVRYGNLFQALIFGIIHFSPASLPGSIVAVVIFSFLGWFFGRATIETRGIGTSFLMHLLIILAIEFRLFMA